MPLLNPEYFSNWYVVSLDGKPRILNSFQEQLNSQTSLERYVQGDIGNHVADISPKHYSGSISAPILLIRPATINDKLYDAFDVILDYLKKIQNPITNTTTSDSYVNNFDYILENAAINVSTDGADVTVYFESWKQFRDSITYSPNEYDFYARKARFYDIQFGIFGENYLIESATFNFAFNNSKMFYVPGYNSGFGNTFPLYAVAGYQVTGNVNLVIKPDQYETLKFYNDQSPGIFNALRHSLYLKILDRTESETTDRVLNLGDFMFMPSIDLSINANNVIKSTINFVTMFRRTSEIITG